MKEFELRGEEYIELNKLLKLLSLAGTGGEANEMIVGGKVTVNGQIEIQKRKKLRVGDVVKLFNNEVKIK